MVDGGSMPVEGPAAAVKAGPPRDSFGSWASTANARSTMLANKGRDTGPELRLRRQLHAIGLRYFVNRRPVKSIRRTADVVFPKLRIAVFVDGCFWHSCPEHRTSPVRNSSFWAEKLARTVERDRETNEALEAAGWQVIRVWEHENQSHAALAVSRAVYAARAQLSPIRELAPSSAVDERPSEPNREGRTDALARRGTSTA